MTAPVVVSLLTLLLGIQPLTTDLYLPALPTLAADLGARVDTAQLTLSAAIICFGFSQLVCGPLADRFGRRPVLLGGIALYMIASVLAAAAPTIGWLVTWRALQGAAMAAAVTCGRSIVRDLFEPHQGARVMSRALGGLGTIAMLAPLLGAAAVQWVHWRAALMMLALFAAGMLAFVAWRFEETVPRRDPSAMRLDTMWRNWTEVLSHPGFRAWTALLALTYGGLFLFIAASSFVYMEVLGLSRIAYGVVVASVSLVYIGGTILCRRLLASRGLRHTVRIGAILTLTGGLASILFALAGWHTLWALLVPQWVYMLGHGIHQPCGQAGAVGFFPDKAGTAAALSGFLMMLMSFAVGLWLGHAIDGTVYPLAVGLGVFAAGVATVALTLVQRHGERPLAPIARAA